MMKGKTVIPFGLKATVALVAALTAHALGAAPPSIAWNAETGRAVLTNGRLELIIDTKTGINAHSLRDTQSGTAYADRDYSWPGGGFPKLQNAAESRDGQRRVFTLKGKLGALDIEQRFALPEDQPGAVIETLTIRNSTAAPLPTADFKCGLAKVVRNGEAWSGEATDTRFCPVPYRRETNGQMQEFPMREVAEHGVTYGGWFEPAHPTPIWGAEGWVWSKGASSLLLAKYNSSGMEWSLMEPEKRGAETIIRFSGAGQWKNNHPEAATRLEAGKAYTFGETLIQAIDGDWKQGYYAYRNYVDAKGCKPPKDYDPPIHWNELYDNEYFFKVAGFLDAEWRAHGTANLFSPATNEKNKQLLDQYYSLELMKAEAAKAKELGCELLYLDPGWDTGSNQQVWDAARLGPMDGFVKMVREEYGFRGVGLWCSLAGVPPTLGDPAACPPEARVIKADGKPDDLLLCLASPAFLDTKEKRLLEVCKNGALFLMFDSDQYTGPCYDKSHGHQVPSTREDHAKALIELARRVRSKYPGVFIEMHDFITGPCNIHYTPTYFGYDRPASFTCLWGHEFMWNPIDDVLSHRAVSLYYYNLAYNIPFYLHINLKSDNENALVFWWFASTIRHLGVGGKGPAPVWEAQKKAMQQYKSLKRFYTQGAFYGLDEMVHVHTLADVGEAVVNVFNLEDKPVERTIRFRPDEIGLPAGLIDVEGAPAQRGDNEVSVNVSVPAKGHMLLRVHGHR